MAFNQPHPREPFTKDSAVSPVWQQFLSRVYEVCFALQQSGTTAQRPITGLWIGRRYFDTTLGKPIWLSSVGAYTWVDATGAVV